MITFQLLIISMREKLLLSLTETEATFYNQSCEKIFQTDVHFKKTEEELSYFLNNFPNKSLHLLIDPKDQYIHEETLPSLPPWDRAQYIYHKKKEWRSSTSFFGYQFLKQDGALHLRWILIPQNDPLTQWLLWFKSLSHNKGDVFFVSLELGRFLKNQRSSAAPYSLLLYKMSESPYRYVLFKGDRLLLSRPFLSKADVRDSLHFLSRRFPDIYDELQSYTLTDKTPLSHPGVIKIKETNSLLNYFLSQKRPVLKINQSDGAQKVWIKKASLCGLGVILFLNIILLYKIFSSMTDSKELYAEAEKVRARLQTLQSKLKGKDIDFLQKAFTDYQYLKSQKSYSWQTLEKLSVLLNPLPLKLETLKIKQKKGLEITLSLSLPSKSSQDLMALFDAFLEACKRIFPGAEIEVLEAPFNSASHETLKKRALRQAIAKVRLSLP